MRGGCALGVIATGDASGGLRALMGALMRRDRHPNLPQAEVKTEAFVPKIHTPYPRKTYPLTQKYIPRDRHPEPAADPGVQSALRNRYYTPQGTPALAVAFRRA
jgi:hypothetical protein